ncbi:unnamed protein product [Mytilus coruscus]|uniref:Uncharacterized protein n=1 Tax=Mytilus coruscus TaxID=42192 RepID=A0A6J8DIN6_MYTCO|nr:unnamed protein product [Mytilus coruscus]
MNIDNDSSAKTDEQPSTDESDSLTFIQNLSQTSSWSAYEKKGEILLEDINTALSLLSNGRTSPLKYQVRTDIASLHPSSQRMLKRKATTAIDALMDCLAPVQANIPMELKSEFLKDIEVGECNILSWNQHLIHCANQNRCRQTLLGSLKKEVFIIMDWAMKFCPYHLGENCLTAGDMKNAIDALGGVMGCQAAHVQINSEVAAEATKFKNTWKGITRISNIQLRGRQVIAYKAYEVGSGNVMSEEHTKKISHSPLSSTELVVLVDFVVPKKQAGNISYKAHDLVHNVTVEMPLEINNNETIQPSSDVFSFIEPGFPRVFQTYSGLESHIILGNHQFKLNQCSAYDNMKWKESCLNIAEHATVSRDSQLTLGTPSSGIGWTIKKERKNQRFTENVKTYLRAMFNTGEQSGRKSNAEDVSRNMRVCRNENG